MKVLVVAPEIDGLPKLAQTSELTRLGDVPGIDVQPLIGPLVTQDRIQGRLRSGRYDVALWSGHGARGRLLLPGGAEVEPRWLASELRRSGVTLLVLAVCESTQRHLSAEGFSDVLPAAGVHLIAMTASIADVSAVDYDVAMLHALASGETLREAHRVGIEAIKEPDISQPQLFMSDAASANDLAARSEALKQAMAAGQSDDALAIIHQCKTILGDLEEHYRALDDRVLAIERKISPPWQVRLWQGLAAFVVAVAASLFFVYQARELLFNPWFVGVAFETTLLALALLCWRMAVVTLERMQ